MRSQVAQGTGNCDPPPHRPRSPCNPADHDYRSSPDPSDDTGRRNLVRRDVSNLSEFPGKTIHDGGLSALKESPESKLSAASHTPAVNLLVC